MHYRQKPNLVKRIAIVGGLTSSLTVGGCLLGDLAVEGFNVAAGTQINPRDAEILRASSRVAGRATQRHQNTRVKYEEADVEIYTDKGLSQNRIEEERELRNLETRTTELPTIKHAPPEGFSYDKQVSLIYFYKSGNPICEDMSRFLESLEEIYPLDIKSYDTTNRRIKKLFKKYMDEFQGVEKIGLGKAYFLPATFFPNHRAIVGSDKESRRAIEREIRKRSCIPKKPEPKVKESKYSRATQDVLGKIFEGDETPNYRIIIDKVEQRLEENPLDYERNIQLIYKALNNLEEIPSKEKDRLIKLLEITQKGHLEFLDKKN